MDGGNFSRTGYNLSQCDKAPSWQFIWRVSPLEYNVFCIPQKQMFPVLWIPSTALKDAYHQNIHAYTAGVAVAQRKKLILRMRVGRLLTAAVVHVVSFAARGVKAMR